VRCQLLLERATSSYAQLLAATTLTKLVSRPTQIISLPQRIQISMERRIKKGVRVTLVIMFFDVSL